MKIFVISVNSTNERRHFEQSVAHSADRTLLRNHSISEDDLNNIEKDAGGYYLWGVLPGQYKPRWDEMTPGDYLLIIYSGTLKYFAKILFKANDPEISQKLWGNFNTSTFQYIFFFTKPLQLVGVEPLKNQVRFAKGLGRISDEEITSAVAKYGAVENFLRIRFKVPIKIPQIEEALRRDDVVKLKTETTFHFEAARQLLREFLEFQIDENLCRDIIDEYTEAQKQKLSYYDYTMNLNEGTTKRVFAELTGRLIAHLDYRASGKNIWNPEGRTIAGTQIRQTFWVKSLLNFKIGNDANEQIPKGVRNCIRLLEDPSTGIQMISDNHRKQVAENLLFAEYKPDSFIGDVREFFRPCEIRPANADNENVVYGKILYNPEVKKLWNKEQDPEADLELNEEAEFDSTESEDTLYTKYSSAIKTKPFLIFAGLSGSGKSREARSIAYMYCPPELQAPDNGKPGNFELVKVRPNWHDSSELLGYESRISGKPRYIVTDFIRFLVKAWKHEEVPFILCLDEMNLAPVEQYFAEYLSVLETRIIREGKIVSDSLLSSKVFQDFDNDEFKRSLGFDFSEQCNELFSQFRKDGLCLPPNLIVIGTVNMDETTYSFSRKVLDRALTIEMNEIDLDRGLTEEEVSWKYPKEAPKESVLPEAVSLKNVVDYLSESNNHKTIIGFLETLNEGLKGTPFQVAYRARDEFLYYAYYSLKSGRKIEDALDDMICMKVLTRIEGDENMLGKSLSELRGICEMHRLKKSFLKCDEMLKKLEYFKFSSFWQ